MNTSPTDPNCDLNNPASIPASIAGQTPVGPGAAGEVKLNPEFIWKSYQFGVKPGDRQLEEVLESIAKLKQQKERAEIACAFMRNLLQQAWDVYIPRNQVTPEFSQALTDAFRDTTGEQALFEYRAANVISEKIMKAYDELEQSLKAILTHVEEFDNAEDTNGELAAVRKIKAIVERHV